MSIWSAVKHAINGTLGTEKFKPLDELMEKQCYQNAELTAQSIGGALNPSLKIVFVPWDWENIENGIYDNSDISSVVIHDKVTSVGESAFYGCGGLRSVVIGAGVTEIGENAFGATGLESVFYRSTVEDWGNIYIDDTAFEEGTIINCTNGVITI